MNFILDEEFDENTSVQREKNSFLSRIAGLSLVALLAILGGTYAANINIGTGQSQEFGQGIQITSSCDSDMKVIPVAKYRNDAVVRATYVQSFDFSNVSNNCSDKLFVLRAYPETASALSGNSSMPFRTFKFHFNMGGWIRDDFGCANFQMTTVGSIESNSAQMNLENCFLNWNGTSWGVFDQPPLKANEMYKFTLETRPYTVAKVELQATDTSTHLGWAVKTEEGDFISVMSNSTNFPLYPDLAVNDTFMVFGAISSSDYNNAARNSNIYTLTASSNVSCRYSGKYQANSQISEAPFIGKYSPGGYSWVSYVCKATGAGSITLS